jgi:hypothetical protein
VPGAKGGELESGKNERIPLKVVEWIFQGSDCGEKSEGRSGEREGEGGRSVDRRDVRRSKVDKKRD